MLNIIQEQLLLIKKQKEWRVFYLMIIIVAISLFLSYLMNFGTEWLLIIFIIIGISFIKYKIDSRFIILGGLIFLSFSSTILISRNLLTDHSDSLKVRWIAESFADCAYYLISIGIFFLLIENKTKNKIKIKLLRVLKRIVKSKNDLIQLLIISSIITILFFLEPNLKTPFFTVIKAGFIYLTISISVFIEICFLIKKKNKKTSPDFKKIEKNINKKFQNFKKELMKDLKN